MAALAIAYFSRFLRQQGAALSGIAGPYFARRFLYMVNLMIDTLVRFAGGRWPQGRESGAGMGKAQTEGKNRHQGNPHHIPPSFYVLSTTCRHHLSNWCCLRSDVILVSPI